MEIQLFSLKLLEEAREFLFSIPEIARKKMGANIRVIQSGIKDPEIFQKCLELRRSGNSEPL